MPRRKRPAVQYETHRRLVDALDNTIEVLKARISDAIVSLSMANVQNTTPDTTNKRIGIEALAKALRDA